MGYKLSTLWLSFVGFYYLTNLWVTLVTLKGFDVACWCGL